ncbi:MAG: GNAT family N-acetyltransferase [Deltaproteobacteria bacterium HGW-Deltaproteobacteria-17]|nr:MAG: GNAT family N-acetyltransferase [Deltaproteobacteria bacterium HGW-Deltaproteobacteria-17]
MNLTIRPEEQRDREKIEDLTREAFWNLYRPGCDEHYLAHTMRDHPDYLDDLAHVAVLDDVIVGSIRYMKSQVRNERDETIDTATFGPLCVDPGVQRQGIGTRLIEHTKRLLIRKGTPAIIILGDPHNYCKHGFKNGKDFHITSSDGRFPLGLLVLELKQGVFADHRWRFQESTAYDLDPEKVEAYDRRFPPKTKEYRTSQELFGMMIRAYLD